MREAAKEEKVAELDALTAAFRPASPVTASPTVAVTGHAPVVSLQASARTALEALGLLALAFAVLWFDDGQHAAGTGHVKTVLLVIA